LEAEELARLEAERRAREALRQREEGVMAKPVAKKARRLPLGFQKKQMTLDSATGALSYRKYSEGTPRRAKELRLDQITALEQQNTPRGDCLLVLTVSAGAGRGGRKYTFKMPDREASDVWLKHLRIACRNVPQP
jgi:hypothetical protein